MSEPCACGGVIESREYVHSHNRAWLAHIAWRWRESVREERMRMRARRFVLVGPMPCKVCRVAVYYGEDQDDTTRMIRNVEDAWPHRCRVDIGDTMTERSTHLDARGSGPGASTTRAPASRTGRSSG